MSVGDIIETHRGSGEFIFDWRISDFWQHTDNWYCSPIFSFCNERWNLQMELDTRAYYPVLKDILNCMEISLNRDNLYPAKSVNIAFAIKVADGEGKKVDGQLFFADEGAEGYIGALCPMSDLRDQKARLVPDDVLTITCTLKSKAVKMPFFEKHENLSRSLKAMLVEGKYSDFTVKVKDREWKVHKMILEGRSEYFATMFSQEWAENKTGEAIFDDIKKDVMDIVLHFIYTGQVENMTSENVCGVYVAAHKFLLEDLKEMCVFSMENDMGTDIVFDALAMSKIYEEEDIEKSVVRYLSEQDKRLLDMPEWKQLEQNDPPFVAEIWKKVKEDRKRRFY